MEWKKGQHQPASPHSAKTQDFNSNMIIIIVRTSNLIKNKILIGVECIQRE
jgi:hypothetical protein